MYHKLRPRGNRMLHDGLTDAWFKIIQTILSTDFLVTVENQTKNRSTIEHYLNPMQLNWFTKGHFFVVKINVYRHVPLSVVSVNGYSKLSVPKCFTKTL